jgi:hypothetical protein
MWPLPRTLLPLPVPFQAHDAPSSGLPSGLVSSPSISCRPTPVPRSLSQEVHRLSRALLCGAGRRKTSIHTEVSMRVNLASFGGSSPTASRRASLPGPLPRGRNPPATGSAGHEPVGRSPGAHAPQSESRSSPQKADGPPRGASHQAQDSYVSHTFNKSWEKETQSAPQSLPALHGTGVRGPPGAGEMDGQDVAGYVGRPRRGWST